MLNANRLAYQPLRFHPLAVLLAWLEYRVTRQISTGNGERYLASDPNPNDYFTDIECGYGSGQGPNLEANLHTLGRVNARHQKQLADQREVAPEVLAYYSNLHGETIRTAKRRSPTPHCHRSRKRRKAKQQAEEQQAQA